MLDLLNILKYSKKNENESANDSDDEENNEALVSESTKKYGQVGLKNLGNISYMNSIIQQMYMVPTFRYAIISADEGEFSNQNSKYQYSENDYYAYLLHQLQKMYTYLTFSDKIDYNPRDFCFSYKNFDGNPINVMAQQDNQKFYNNFCNKIENSLKKTQFKYIVNDVFSGKTCSSIKCQNCKHISNRFEDFYNLTLEVKNITTLKDSLQKLNVPQIISDFKCPNCKQKVTINTITSLNKLPNVLVVHLKRFYLDYESYHIKKINSKFEFPRNLNLKHFVLKKLQKICPKKKKLKMKHLIYIIEKIVIMNMNLKE